MIRYMDLPQEFLRKRSELEEQKRRHMIEQAMQESEVLRKIKHERSEKAANCKILFCLWNIMDDKLKALEKIRDEHAPHSLEDEWDDEFCDAIRQIPDVKDVCEDLWYAYCMADKIEGNLSFCKYV